MKVKHYLPLEVILLLSEYLRETELRQVGVVYDKLVAKAIRGAGYKVAWIRALSGGRSQRGNKFIELTDGVGGNGIYLSNRGTTTCVMHCTYIRSIGLKNVYKQKLLGKVVAGKWQEETPGATIIHPPNNLFERREGGSYDGTD